MRGIVIKSTGSWYKVLLPNNKIVDGRLRGKFKNLGLKLTNPIAVGDNVELEIEPGQLTYVITEIGERTNYFIRKSTRKTEHCHIIASNIDLALLVVSLKSPRTSTGFIDRFLAIANKHQIPTVIAFNKVDLLKEKHLDKAHHLKELYNSIGSQSLLSSVTTGDNMDQLKSITQGKTVMVAGHSGVGKSSILNTLYPDLDLRTGDISGYTNKGTHTTTHAEMHLLADGTRIIDTPGIKEIGLADIEKHEISHYFPEMVKWANQCKFNNCTHVHEPKCEVLNQLELGNIPEERYQNYLSMLEDD